MRKVLLLGATGFVGKNVARLMKENKIDYSESSRALGTDLCDIRQTLSLMEDVKPDIVVNCAAHVGSLNYVTEKAADVVLDNSRMLMNIYESLAKVNPKALIVNPLANCAYPAKADTFKEDNWWDGHLHRSVLSYGSTRRFMWSLGESFDMQYGMRSIHLLVPNMYGEFDSTDPNKAHALNALISKFVKAEMENLKEIEVWGTGIAIREWLLASDFARIVISIIQNTEKIGLQEPVNIAQNFGLSVRELVGIINTYFDNKFVVKWNHNMPDGAPKKVMDDTKFRKVFPDFEFTPFTTGIPATIKFYQNVYPY